MKKLLFALSMVVIAIGANAQVMKSRTIVKEKTKTMWYGRIGLSINNIAGGNDFAEYNSDEDVKASIRPKAGMDINVGFQRAIGKSGIYWGMELGFGTRGGSYREAWYQDSEYLGDEISSITTWNLKYSPFTFGYKYSITDDLKLDAHLGIYASYDFAGKGRTKFGEDDEDATSTLGELSDEYDYLAFDAGMQIGIGAWWKHFNLDFTYQRGFVPCGRVYGYNEYTLYSSNFMIRLGYSF